MRVGVQRDADSGVAEPFLNDLGVNALLERPSGVSVAKVVESDAGEAGSGRYLGKGVVECVGTDGDPSD